MLPPINTAGYTPQQIMMTLSAIAYADPATELQNELSNAAYATRGLWNLVWGPVDETYGVNLDNLMYVVQLTGTNTFAVAIRGTVYPHNLSTLSDLYEDFEVSHTLPWPYPPVAGSLVAGGTLFGLNSLTGMKYNGQTIFDFLNSLISPTIYVTGHSLGGCLATVLAPWLLYQLNQAGNAPAGIYPYTFAAPSAGNSAFAAWYNATFAISARYYNQLDVVPKAWANLADIKNLFPPTPLCPWTVKGVVDLVNGWLDALQVGYTQPNGAGSALPGVSQVNDDWFAEVGAQHDSNYYLELLGAPQINATSTLPITAHAAVMMQPEQPA